MKYRSDFVTNSSSSSFVIAFKDEEDKRAQKEWMVKYHPEYVNQVFSDIERHIMDYDTALVYYEEHAHWIARFEILYGAENRYRDYEWRKSKACEKMIEKREKEILNEFKKMAKEHNIFAVVSYSDDINSELEHHIMPFVPFVIETINNH